MGVSRTVWQVICFTKEYSYLLRGYIVLQTRSMFACPQCETHLSSPSNLTRHINTCHNESQHVCPDCGKAFTRSDTLQRHRNTTHETTPDPRQWRTTGTQTDLLSVDQGHRRHIDSYNEPSLLNVAMPSLDPLLSGLSEEHNNISAFDYQMPWNFTTPSDAVALPMTGQASDTTFLEPEADHQLASRSATSLPPRGDIRQIASGPSHFVPYDDLGRVDAEAWLTTNQTAVSLEATKTQCFAHPLD